MKTGLEWRPKARKERAPAEGEPLFALAPLFLSGPATPLRS